MAENYYQKALDAAQTELAGLLRQHEEVERRIARLRQTIASLSALSEDGEAPEDGDDPVRIPGAADVIARDIARAHDAVYGREIGFSDAVREVLKAGGVYMTPVQVKEGLIRMGIDLESKYRNPLAVIHTTLKRLEANGEVSLASLGDKTSYRIAPPRRIPGPPKLPKDFMESFAAREQQTQQDTEPPQKYGIGHLKTAGEEIKTDKK